MLRDARRVDLSGKTLVKFKTHGHRFEIIVNPDLALKFKRGNLGEEIPVADILELDIIFHNASKGERASDEIISHVFETEDFNSIIKVILEKGELNLTTDQREEIFEKKRRQVVNLISKSCINPKTRTPHPPGRIKNAIKEAKVTIDLNLSAESQVKDIVKALRSYIPISMETVKIAIRIPPDFTGKAYGEIKRSAQIEKEEWTSDGHWISVVSIAAGLQANFIDMVQGMTKGRADIKTVERIKI